MSASFKLMNYSLIPGSQNDTNPSGSLTPRFVEGLGKRKPLRCFI